MDVDLRVPVTRIADIASEKRAIKALTQLCFSAVFYFQQIVRLLDESPTRYDSPWKVARFDC